MLDKLLNNHWLGFKIAVTGIVSTIVLFQLLKLYELPLIFFLLLLVSMFVSFIGFSLDLFIRVGNFIKWKNEERLTKNKFDKKPWE